MRFSLSGLFKVINFCTDLKPIFDFPLVINNSSRPIIFHRFRDITLNHPKLTTHPSLIPDQADPFEFPRQTYMYLAIAEALCYFAVQTA